MGTTYSREEKLKLEINNKYLLLVSTLSSRYHMPNIITNIQTTRDIYSNTQSFYSLTDIEKLKNIVNKLFPIIIVQLNDHLRNMDLRSLKSKELNDSIEIIIELSDLITKYIIEKEKSLLLLTQ